MPSYVILVEAIVSILKSEHLQIKLPGIEREIYAKLR